MHPATLLLLNFRCVAHLYWSKAVSSMLRAASGFARSLLKYIQDVQVSEGLLRRITLQRSPLDNRRW